MTDIQVNQNQTRYQAVTRSNITKTLEWSHLDPALREAVEIVSLVLPFRTNTYVMGELIDWSSVPDDPMFQLTFPQRDMLEQDDYQKMATLLREGASQEQIKQEANRIRYDLNPHPAGQLTHNVPTLNDNPVPGIQHMYRETILFFPSHGQTCHAYCTFCFRWAQFVGIESLKFSNHDVDVLVSYLKQHPEVTDVLFTGGDPMIMSTKVLSRYIEPLLEGELESVQNIRIGTKAPAYWPQRFVTDADADDLMRLFERVVSAGRHLALMGHYSHPVELSTEIARQAVRRIRSAGAVVRMQSPLVRHVNDNAEAWTQLWRRGVHLGTIPYYMFVARDTGAKNYFEVPLVRAWEIFRTAYRQVSGLARTVRGPSMSTLPGKIHIQGVSELGCQKVFVLEYLRARDTSLVGRPFFARYDPQAVWFDDLEPATPSDRKFFPASQTGQLETFHLKVTGRAAI